MMTNFEDNEAFHTSYSKLSGGYLYLCVWFPWFYNDELVQKASKDLTSPKIHTQKQMLSRVRSTTVNLIRNAERALISPTSFVQDDGPENFLISVGPHYVITRIVCNLLRAPVHKHKRAVDLYETLTKHLVSIRLEGLLCGS